MGWLGSTFGARWSVLVGGFAALLAIGVAMAVLARRPAIGARFAAALREESDGDADRGGAVAEREPER